jgi:hypothetical protein
MPLRLFAICATPEWHHATRSPSDSNRFNISEKREMAFAQVAQEESKLNLWAELIKIPS